MGSLQPLQHRRLKTISTVSNGDFVDSMLDRIQLWCENNNKDVVLTLEQMRDNLEEGVNHGIPSYIYNQIKKIQIRSAELYHVLDPMWFVIALYHRNMGGSWDEMLLYGVKS